MRLFLSLLILSFWLMLGGCSSNDKTEAFKGCKAHLEVARKESVQNGHRSYSHERYQDCMKFNYDYNEY